MANSLAPGYAQLFYGSGTQQHVATFPLRYATPPTPGTVPELELRSGLSAGGQTAFNNLLTAYRAIHPSDVEYNRLDFWYKPTPESNPAFIASVSPGTGLATGSNPASGTIKGVQLSITFRTLAGGLLRIVPLDVPDTIRTLIDTPPFANTAVNSVVTFITGQTNWIVGRDNSFPFVAIRAVGKANDALRKRANNL